MKKIILLLAIIFCLLPGYTFAATQDIHIEWTYDYQPTEGRTLAGYHLYKEGLQVCTSNTPDTSAMDCTFESDDGTFDFTLTAFCTDNYESPHSAPYTLTLSNQIAPSLFDIHLEWSYDYEPIEGKTLAGYHLYKEGVKVCTNNTPADKSMDCNFESLPGTYKFTLTAFCSDGHESPHSVPYSFTLVEQEEPELIASFATTPITLSGDTPFTVSFDAAASAGNITSYSWEFGDNSSGSGKQTSHTYSTPGTFTALLTITNSSGTTNQESATITVDQKPIAAITTAPTLLSGDAPFTVSFNATASTGNIATYAWDFGDSSSGSGSQTSHTYNTAGTFTALLTTTSSNGSTSQKNVTINVAQAPVAAISTEPTTLTGDAPFAVSFNATGSTGDISTYAWDFGDSSSGGGSQTTHTYNTAGTFTALLTITSGNGSISQKNVTINVAQAPVAAISTEPTTLTGDVPFAVSFNATESTGDISSYTWDFGDNSSGSGSQTNHTYDTEGTFTARLTVTSSNGSISQKNITVTATTPEPVAETFDIHMEWSYDYQPIEGKTLAGYNLYKEGVKICTSNTPQNRIMDCSFESLPGTFNFTLTAFCSEGEESPHSPPYSFTLSKNDNPEFAANIITTPANLSGTIPFTVQFDGASSPGATSYKWLFGDGDVATESLSEHTYNAAGTFTTVLTVTDSTGQINSRSVTVTVSETNSENTDPVAAIDSSTALGDAPLTVTFDGSNSTDTEGAINTYTWNFGDGSASTTGANASHTYLAAGTYSASLTVTDNQGATNTNSTPVIVTGQTIGNQAPTASIATSTTNGSVPFPVTFDGTASSDPEKEALTYSWNFGDGSSGQGSTTEHTYSIQGSFTATLTVTDNMGATDQATTVINTDAPPATFKIELGEVSITNEWVQVDITESFTNPIIVVGPPSYNDSEPCVIRLKNISPNSFDIRIQEWDYNDGTHSNETVAYLILEQGSFTLEDGTKVEAGQFEATDTNFKSISFAAAFNSVPVVMTSIATDNESDTVTARIRNISTTSFEHKTQEQESLKDGHAAETVHFIAWEPSATNMGGFSTIVNKTADTVKHSWYTIDYAQQLSSLPIFLGTMQTQDGGDTAAIRYTNKTTSSIQVMIEEEQSANSETSHTTEEVGYFLFYAN